MANYIMQNSGQDLDNAVTAYKNGTIAKSKVGLGNVDNTSDANKPLSTATQTALNAKANRVNDSGGFEAGEASAAIDGGAVGYGAETVAGGSIGLNSNSSDGGAIGSGAYTTDGGAIGIYASANGGGAVGMNAVTGDGFAGGANAVTMDSEGIIDAIQLGTGTNSTAKTMQVYNKCIVNADGSLTDVGALSGLTTTAKNTIVAAINELKANGGGGVTDLGKLSVTSADTLGGALLSVITPGIYKFKWTENDITAGENMDSLLFVVVDDSVGITQIIMDGYVGIGKRIIENGATENVSWDFTLWESSIINNLTTNSARRALSAQQGTVLKDLVDSKADSFYGTGGGFVGGTLADLTTDAHGAALGNEAKAGNGGAVGQFATVNDGGAIGDSSVANNGFAGGSGAVSDGTGGSATGLGARATEGGAVGSGTYTTNGGAVGQNARAGDGFAGGKNAYAVNSVDDCIDAIQLGTGTNSTPQSFQVYSYQMMDPNGKIPINRLPQNVLKRRASSLFTVTIPSGQSKVQYDDTTTIPPLDNIIYPIVFKSRDVSGNIFPVQVFVVYPEAFGDYVSVVISRGSGENTAEDVTVEMGLISLEYEAYE